MATKHLIIIGDARSMDELSDASVHMAITSPPYVTSKFGRGQPFDVDEYLDLVRGVFKEVYRVLMPDGRFCLNVADVRTKYYYKDDDRFYRLPLGHMVLDQALKMGFRLLETFIWDKGFHRHMGGAFGPLFGSYPYPATILSNVYWEYVFVLVKPGPKRAVPKEIKERSKISFEKWKEYTRKIWRVESESEWIKEHPAVFPVEIARRFIEMYSFVGDTVLDPFLGSGTTTWAARLMRRNSVGYEINPRYIGLIKRRVRIDQPLLLEEPDEIKIIVREDARETEWI